MRKITVFFLIGFLACAISSNVSAQDLFKINTKDLNRVWLKQISEMKHSVDFESGNYRLDPDFQLGFGDSLRIHLAGRLTAEYEIAIDRKGNIVIPNLGKVSILGLTMEEAKRAIEQKLNEKYTNVDLEVTLADVRDIRIYVMGNVANPGTYAISPFAHVISALKIAGGLNDHGSLIDIKVIREGEDMAAFNVYDFFRHNNHQQNIRLKQGDIVQVGEADGFFIIKGDVRYPGAYEMSKDARLSDLINLAGGMLPTKFERRVLLLRMNIKTQQQEIIEEFNFDGDKPLPEDRNILLEYNDRVIVTTAFNYNPSPVELYKSISLQGELVIPGEYLAKKNDTLSSLLKKSAGVKSTAFVEGAVFTRESLKEIQQSMLEKQVKALKKSLLEEEARLGQTMLSSEEREMKQEALQKRRDALNVISSQVPEGRMIIDLAAILTGEEDVLLQHGDRLLVPQTPDSVLVTGAVYNPEAVFYRQGEKFDYYLNAVGGPSKDADRDNIYIIKANGQAKSAATGYGEINRGDIIVVPEKDW